MNQMTLEQARQNILLGIRAYFQGTKQQHALMDESLRVCGIEEPADVEVAPQPLA